MTSKRILELANKACFLYFTRNRDDQAKLLRMVLSNCEVDGVSTYPTYRKPFDRVFEHAKSENWQALEDDLRTLIGEGFESEDVGSGLLQLDELSAPSTEGKLGIDFKATLGSSVLGEPAQGQGAP